MDNPDFLDKLLHPVGGADGKSVRVITIRLPAELHAALNAEARARQTSVNKLAIAKLRVTGALLDNALKAAKISIPKR